MSTFGNNIRKIRSVRGLTQAQLAEMIDVNRGMISSYEEGRAEPKIETILKTADVFRLTTDMLLKKNITVNQLTGFTLPKMENAKSEMITQSPPVVSIFSFLPANSQAFEASQIQADNYLKKNDIVLTQPQKVTIAKTMILKTAEYLYMGKVTGIDAKKISIDSTDKIIIDCIESFEVLGIYSPVQNISPLEERLGLLESKVQKLEARLQQTTLRGQAR